MICLIDGRSALDSGMQKGARRFLTPLPLFWRVRPNYRPPGGGNVSVEHSRLGTNACRFLILWLCGHGIANGRLSSLGSISQSARGVTSPAVDIGPGDPMIG